MTRLMASGNVKKRVGFGVMHCELMNSFSM